MQREAAEREIAATRRYAAFPGSKPESLSAPRRWFAETGSTPLIGNSGEAADETAVAQGMVTLAGDLGWRFTLLVALDAWAGWHDLAQALKIPVDAAVPDDSGAIPLVAARNPALLPGWATDAQTPTERGRGLSLALHQEFTTPPADVAGLLAGIPARAVDLGFAVEAAQHPEGRLRGRVLS